MDKLFTDKEWFSFPLEFRVRWWRETEYGTKPPTDPLLAHAMYLLGLRETP